MQHTTYTIFNASAGSGKTFTLTKAYIKILLQSDSPSQFRHLLALTFTNKAVGEMKTRIIEMLYLFSKDDSISKQHAMFSVLCEELKIAPKTLQYKSKTILKYLLHNFGAFDISTIDGFTHRIIRTFAHDLKLPLNFEVELNQDRLLQEAVDSLISKAGTDQVLTKSLIDFALEKADDDKSWDISVDFNKIAKLIVNENNFEALNKLSNKSILDFLGLKQLISKTIIHIEADLVKIGDDMLELLQLNDLNFDDFSGKLIPNYFQKLSQRNFGVEHDKAWQQKLVEGQNLYPSRVDPSKKDIIDSLQPVFIETYERTRNLYFKLKIHKNFFKNLTPLSVLSAIQKELTSLMTAQNKLLISDFNKIISKEIKDQPTPFIYERLGEKYKHYFIDEFQDTSKMQWHNLLPLLDNSLSAANGSLLLVGDAKQAIYRWRGGFAEQFINLYNKIETPFQILPQVASLDINYRSFKAIVKFNNDFFNFLGENYFSAIEYGELYKASHQKVQKQNEGFVNIEFLDLAVIDNKTDHYSQHVYDKILECYDKGYVPSDICVIVRKRKEGVAIANYLSNKGITVTSSETLLLKNSKKVTFLNNLLKLLLQPTNASLKIEVLSFLAEQHNITDKHLFFTRHLNSKILFDSLEADGIITNVDKPLDLPLYDLIEVLLRGFSLDNTSDAYLNFYLDFVYEHSHKENSDLNAFLSYFEKEKDRLSVIAPENANAIQIMTIHKSKGLEFPVVIFPFAELNIYREVEPKAWYPDGENDLFGFETLLINYNKEIQHYGKAGKDLYDIRQSQLELDNINLLYVVLTRAVEGLFIISKRDINNKGIINNNTYAGMLISFLKHNGNWNDNQLKYNFGEIKAIEKTELTNVNQETIDLISAPKSAHNLRIITKSGDLWDTLQHKAIERGNKVHLVMSKIKTFHDIEFALDELITTGIISNPELNDLKQMVDNIVYHNKLSDLFSNNDRICNEQDIITKTGEILRPDRININDENKVTLIDYKTGSQNANHKLQLDNYAQILEEMKYKIDHKYLVYINDKVEVVEV